MSMDNPEKSPEEETDHTPESPTTHNSPGLPTEPPAADISPNGDENPEITGKEVDPTPQPQPGMPAGAVGQDPPASGEKSHGSPLKQAVSELSEAAKIRAREFQESGRKMYDQRREDFSGKRDEWRLRMEQKAEDFNRKAVDTVDDLVVKARDLQRKGEEEVRKDPVKGIGIAAGVGFLVALLFTGRRK